MTGGRCTWDSATARVHYPQQYDTSRNTLRRGQSPVPGPAGCSVRFHDKAEISAQKCLMREWIRFTHPEEIETRLLKIREDTVREPDVRHNGIVLAPARKALFYVGRLGAMGGDCVRIVYVLSHLLPPWGGVAFKVKQLRVSLIALQIPKRPSPR